MIYVDESIQQALDYICVGFAHCDSSPDDDIRSAIRSTGLVPEFDEYKSGARMVASPRLQQLRKRMYEVVRCRCALGVYVAPTSERQTLLVGTLAAARQIVLQNKLPLPQKLFLDQGITGTPNVHGELDIVTECDSKTILGIQLADFVAYHCSLLLKATLTGVSKKVIVEETPHPATGEEVNLDWMVRTDFRRNFFVEPRDVEQIVGDDFFYRAEGYGAFFSPRLSPQVGEAARKTFGEMYLGCVW